MRRNDIEEQPIRLQLNDVNDELPEFLNAPKPFLTTVHMNTPAGTSVYQLVGEDKDRGSKIQYMLDSGDSDRFDVDKDTGMVRTKGSHSFPQGREFEIGVSCMDISSPVLQRSATHSLKILVGEREPQFYETQYVASFPETAQQMHQIVQIKAISHQGYPITYELTTESGGQSNEFAIDQVTGVVDLLKPLDYEKDPQQYHLRVKAVENGRPSKTSVVNFSKWSRHFASHDIVIEKDLVAVNTHKLCAFC
ncbi:hypothetical protein HELRODRAFT_179301 [Helobdella robusta]|uniref:Cadherin domain-containing protein n=1 Tax=Helobdella robusta TaxID=6412 RepID=T1FEI4_HELRO|nr:hypothetical protein HELRODRAFT_179301 [Helobdella robusta]ESN95526.1 hypothetical protein HELRODRAFT_179301 [Helobdella robusta]